MMKDEEKWFCVGQSGATADGRQISAEDLVQAAESYDPKTYTAVLNVEHFRPIFPNSDLGGLGAVTALKAEATDGKTKLFAKIEATEKAKKMFLAGEKLFTSMELQRNFADTGKTYLVGLALTDSPASLGTSKLKFNIAAAQSELISTYTEMTKMSEKQSIWAKAFANMFTKAEPEAKTEAPAETKTEANPQEGELKEAFSVVEQLIEDNKKAAAIVTQLTEENRQAAEDFAALKQEFEAFKAQIQAAPANTQAPHLGAAVSEKSAF